MPHITEGLLHAHLDGALGPDEELQWADAEAHLEVCDDCRRRLDEAAELRAAAHDLLAGAAPSRSTTRPAFDELAARARARQVDPASGRKPSKRAGGAWWRKPATLGWAASLVIAAGAGWIGRQLVVEQGLDGPPVAARRDSPVGGARMEEGAAQDAAATPAAPRTAARFRAEQENAEPQADPKPGADADAIRMQEIEPLAAGAEVTVGARCYAASPAVGDGREAAARNPETLRLAPDGTATLRFGGQPMVGFWEPARGDSLHLRVTDGEEWWEYVLIEAVDGVRGDATLDAVRCP